MCALASFALLPEDDYTLACLLKSPFVGMSEEDLFSFCHQRPGYLWESLRKSGDAALLSWLEKLLASPYRQNPYAFFYDVLMCPCPADPHSGMRAMRARLGDDMLDPLDEFLNSALRFERQQRGGLQSFLHAQQQNKTEIKREMEEAGRAVRIMTVHGSKGLQAPIVFLPDTIRTSQSVKPDKLLWPSKTGLEWPVYISSVKNCPASLSGIRDELILKSHAEYRRLLYVAMTRAEERLYIGGYINKRGPGAGQTTPYWYNDMRTGLIAQLKKNRPDESVGDNEATLFLSAERIGAADRTGKTGRHNFVRMEIPVWALQPAPAEPNPPRPLTPSKSTLGEQPARSPLDINDTYRFQRGTVTHRLLQSLPTYPPEQRIRAAKKFLETVRPPLPGDVQDSILTETMAILSDPVFADVFAAHSLAEVSVTGLLPGGRVLSGQIDRLAVHDDHVLIIDYKTNRPPPARPEDVPLAYREQMKAYADAVREIYPGKGVRAALLWTDGPRLMEIPV
jgi:ATP-dependent helicase/nuclease subunit A